LNVARLFITKPLTQFCTTLTDCWCYIWDLEMCLSDSGIWRGTTKQLQQPATTDSCPSHVTRWRCQSYTTRRYLFSSAI